MPRKLALKRLTASDLTLFKWHFQNLDIGNQKAFNLDRSVLVGSLYPQLGEPSLVPQPRYPLDLYLYGPGLAPANNLQRKILKQKKNWRLNGELIDNPVESPELYNVLAPGDFALFEFAGDVTPTTANVVLISGVLPEDLKLHAELGRRFADGSMWVLDDELVQEVLSEASPPAGHPLYDWADTSLLEDAALGGAAGAEAINVRRGSRSITPEDFMRARRIAEATGVAGEEFLNVHFERERELGAIEDFEWTASINAVSLFDFRVTANGGEVRLVDAKSTTGPFTNPIHLSFGELHKAVHGPESYDIYRLYRVSGDRAEMRIARSIGPRLRPVLEVFRSLPDKVRVDGLSVQPDLLNFSEEEIILGASPDEDSS